MSKSGDAVKGAATFLSIFVPQAAPFLAAAPGLIEAIRGAFRKIGGNDADLDAILAGNQKIIDRLKNPDSFRKKRPT